VQNHKTGSHQRMLEGLQQRIIEHEQQKLKE